MGGTVLTFRAGGRFTDGGTVLTFRAEGCSPMGGTVLTFRAGGLFTDGRDSSHLPDRETYTDGKLPRGKERDDEDTYCWRRRA